jgi:hypothetical protein
MNLREMGINAFQILQSVVLLNIPDNHFSQNRSCHKNPQFVLMIYQLNSFLKELVILQCVGDGFRRFGYFL